MREKYFVVLYLPTVTVTQFSVDNMLLGLKDCFEEHKNQISYLGLQIFNQYF